MNYFTWTIKAETERLLSSSQGIATNYFLPIPTGVSPRHIAGSMVFIILRGARGDVLFKKVHVKKVEEQLRESSDEPEGLLLSANFFRSFGIAMDYRSGLDSYMLDSPSSRTLGFNAISKTEAEEFMELIISRISSRMKVPTSDFFSSIDQNILNDLDDTSFSAQVFKEMTKRYAITSIWGSVKIVNPYVNFSACFTKLSGTRNTKHIIEQLQVFAKDLFTIDEAKPTADRFIVDLDFTPIDISKIRARRFIAAEPTWDMNSSMMKTEDAERKHQDILKDISEFFIRQGLVPEQSASIDLALRSEEQCTIFEIKTLNLENISSQVAKGIFQLATYAQAMLNAKLDSPRKVLILEDLNSLGMQDFIQKTALSLGIEILFYNSRLEWPDRLVPRYL